jgi:hypothetical protein
VELARGDDGVNVAVFVPPSYKTVAGINTLDGPRNVKVVPLMVAGFIASLKIAETVVLVATPVALFNGETDMIIGAVISGVPGHLISNTAVDAFCPVGNDTPSV